MRKARMPLRHSRSKEPMKESEPSEKCSVLLPESFGYPCPFGPRKSGCLQSTISRRSSCGGFRPHLIAPYSLVADFDYGKIIPYVYPWRKGVFIPGTKLWIHHHGNPSTHPLFCREYAHSAFFTFPRNYFGEALIPSASLDGPAGLVKRKVWKAAEYFSCFPYCIWLKSRHFSAA